MAHSRLYGGLLAATTAVAVVVSATAPAPAAAATAPHQPATVVQRSTPEEEVCLFQARQWCLGAHIDAAGAVIVALDELGRAGTVIIIIEWFAAHNATVAKVVEVLGKIGGGRPEAIASSIVGECLGAWGPGQDVHPGSCTSTHGIYWQLGNGKAWNTYAKGDMVTGSPGQNEDVWVLHTPKPGDYVVWTETCTSGC